VCDGKRIDVLSHSRYRELMEINTVPRVDDFVRIRQKSPEEIKDKGFEYYDLEYKVTKVTFDYKQKSIFVYADQVGIERFYAQEEEAEIDKKKKKSYKKRDPATKKIKEQEIRVA